MLLRNLNAARTGERTSLPGQYHLQRTRSVRLQSDRLYFASSATEPTKSVLRRLSAYEVSAHPSSEENTYGLGGGEGRGLGVGACLGVGVGLGVVVGVPVAVAVGVGVTLGVGVAVGVLVGVTVGVAVGVAVGVGVGPEGVMLKAPLVEELFWKRTSLATIRI